MTNETNFTGILCRGCGGECERGDRGSICRGCRSAYDLGRSEAMAKRLPRLTAKVLRGVIAATAAGLATSIGDGGDFDDQDGEDMQAAFDWAKAVRRARED